MPDMVLRPTPWRAKQVSNFRTFGRKAVKSIFVEEGPRRQNNLGHRRVPAPIARHRCGGKSVGTTDTKF